MLKKLRTADFACLVVFVCSSVFIPCQISYAEPVTSNTLIIIDPGKGIPASSAKKYIVENGGQIGDSFSPDIFMAYVPPSLDAKLVTKHGAVIFRDEIQDTAVVEKYGEAAVSAAKVWNNNLELLSLSPPPLEKKHLKIILETDGTNFNIISKKVIRRPIPAAYRQPLAEGFYYIEAADASGKTVSVQSVSDPTKVYYDFTEKSGIMNGGEFRAAKGTMILRLPYNPNIKTLKISRQKASVKGKILGTDKPSKSVRASDLEHKANVELGTIPEENE